MRHPLTDREYADKLCKGGFKSLKSGHLKAALMQFKTSWKISIESCVKKAAARRKTMVNHMRKMTSTKRILSQNNDAIADLSAKLKELNKKERIDSKAYAQIKRTRDRLSDLEKKASLEIETKTYDGFVVEKNPHTNLITFQFTTPYLSHDILTALKIGFFRWSENYKAYTRQWTEQAELASNKIIKAITE